MVSLINRQVSTDGSAPVPESLSLSPLLNDRMGDPPPLPECLSFDVLGG
jgi:hypothetical protein